MPKVSGFRTSSKTGNVFPLFSGQTSLGDFQNVQAQDANRPDAIANYKARQEAKAERYRELAAKNLQKSKEAYEAGRRIGDNIPFGQPILVGHHSERGHRRDLERMHNLTKKEFELRDKSKYYEKKVENIENPYAIRSDDPEAIVKLKKEMDLLEKRREEYKAKPRPKRDYTMRGDDLVAAKIEHVVEHDTRRIRAIKKRIDELQKTQAIPESEKRVGNAVIKIDQSDNRVKILFDSIPSPEIREKLKRNGFKWSPTNQAWQRQISNAATYWAEEIVKGNG